jgi:pyridoxine 4-dehydrogenase
MSEFPTVHAGIAGTIDGRRFNGQPLRLRRHACHGCRHLRSAADRDVAKAVLRRAVELGTNFIDTADSYGSHISEELFREALHPYPDDLVIATNGAMSRPKARHRKGDAKTGDAAPVAHPRRCGHL